MTSPEGVALAAELYLHAFGPTGEIGAATGIEFLAGEGVLAAAEPVRRGGGSAMARGTRVDRSGGRPARGRPPETYPAGAMLLFRREEVVRVVLRLHLDQPA